MKQGFPTLCINSTQNRVCMAADTTKTIRATQQAAVNAM